MRDFMFFWLVNLMNRFALADKRVTKVQRGRGECVTVEPEQQRGQCVTSL
jgi:hypothetical protein